MLKEKAPEMLPGTKKLFPTDYRRFVESMMEAVEKDSLPVTLQLDDLKDYIMGDRFNEQQPTIKYMLNAYRVLLTRAGIGMVICVPEGNPNKTANGFWEDSTRKPEYYDGTYQYLKSIGIQEI